MNRREFSFLIAGTAVSALLRSNAFPQQSSSEVGVSPAAAELYRSALILDCNSGPAGTTGDLPIAQSALDMNRNSGVNVIKLSLGGINSNLLATVEEIGYFQRMIEVHPAYFLQVRVPADMERAKREGKLGIIFSFESADMLEGNIERIELFRDLGVRVMQLSYNRKSPFAAGVMEPNGGGLTQLGKDAVKKMNAVGVAVDLSHANAQTTTDAIAASSKPVIMTHAGCTAVHPHPRNKTDEQLRALAAKGGVVGIYDLPYLAASPKQATLDDYMLHMEHALNVIGEDHVGVGSDVGIEPFDTSPNGMAEFNKMEQERQKSGLAAPEEDRPPYVVGLNTPRRIEVIADQLLKRGHSAGAVEKVIGANFSRVLGEIWT
ncbi:MAG: membrane dipeptidase [Terriglobales bacterium]